MSNEPDFDEPVQQPPKKPRKPMKKRRKMRKSNVFVVPPPDDYAVRAKSKKRRGRPIGSKANGHIGKRYTKEQYEAINSLLGMTAKERDAVLDIVRGLAK